MLQPIDEDRIICNKFSEFWTSVFTERWITTSADGDFVGIRTEIKFDPQKEDYNLSHHRILQWGDDIDSVTIDNRKAKFNEGMRIYLQSFYMNADRDIVQDLRNHKSYFGRVTSNYNLTQETVDEIEKELSTTNKKIIESIPSLRKTEEHLATICKTIGSVDIDVRIEPLVRKITDLSRGMDVVMRDDNAAFFPISQHGYGTRSWISFLTLSAFIEDRSQKLKERDDAKQFVILTIEEPEAHLHPQAQRQLFEQLSNFRGQKIVSTHSPNIITQCELSDIIHIKKQDGKTTAIRYKSSGVQSDEESINREVINPRADLLFASAVILCEGLTEELALPVFFTKHFGHAPYSFGVSIIGMGGPKYKQYLSLIKDFNIPWFIFSDGEERAVNGVKSAVQKIFNQDAKSLKNVVILRDGSDYEKYLI